jgi:hypothetical protein
MRIRVAENGKSLNVELPMEDAQLAWQMKRLGNKNGNMCCTLETVWGEHSPLRRLVGQSINMDELNFFAKRFDSLTAYEQGVLGVYAYEQRIEKIKDLINLTYSMQGLSLLTDFSNPEQVGRRLYMDKYLGISENEERRIDFLEYGQKILAEGNCNILPYGVLVENGFVMQEVYHGRTFPEYWYDTGETVAVVEVKNQAGDREYLYLPTDIFSVDRMKSRLQIQDLCECRVEEIHNLRLPERLVPEPKRLCCVEELTYFNELCQKVSQFDPEQMERLAMAAEFVGAEKYTDITYVAEYLHEFEIVPAVHNDEEHGRFLVEKSGLFEVDESLLPYMNYAGFAADKREGTLVDSRYMQGGFIGAVRACHKYLEYQGEFAEQLERTEGSYNEFCLYSPLLGRLDVEEEMEEVYPEDLTACKKQIMAAINHNQWLESQPRGLMHYFHENRAVAAKVYAAWPSVCELGGKLYGVLRCETNAPLTEEDIHVLKDYWTGQMSDGWGESFEQYPIRSEYGDLYVSFWNSGDSWQVMTLEETEIQQEAAMTVSL